jgi:FSR family fosmidomycin resistance protein-like MFS transporter
MGRRRIVAISLALLAPAGYLLFHSPTALAPLAAIAFGFVGDVPMPITMVMGQELLPRNVGVASGLILGLAFVTGGAGVAATGFLADGFGLLQALSILPVMPMLAAGLCLLLPANTAAAANPAASTPAAGTSGGGDHAI